MHKYIHGWRETEKHLISQMATLLNEPRDNIVFRRYIEEAEHTAEVWGWQPIITYLLVAASGLHFVYYLIMAIRG